MRTEMNENGSVDIIVKRRNVELIVATLDIEQMEELYELMRRQDMEDKVNYYIQGHSEYAYMTDRVYNEIVEDMLYKQEHQFEEKDIEDIISEHMNAKRRNVI